MIVSYNALMWRIKGQYIDRIKSSSRCGGPTAETGTFPPRPLENMNSGATKGQLAKLDQISTLEYTYGESGIT